VRADIPGYSITGQNSLARSRDTGMCLCIHKKVSIVVLTLFGSPLRTRILVFLASSAPSYPAELARIFRVRPTEVYRALSALEDVGVVATRRIGSTRLVELESRFFAFEELNALLLRLSLLPEFRGVPWPRRRPRAIGKRTA